MIKIGGFVPFSSVDYPGYLAAVIFCQGCQWRCSYCHNTHLMEFSEGKYSWAKIAKFLHSRKQFLEAVVFSGGEPLLQDNLIDAILYVKSQGFKVGIHTTGCHAHRFIEILHHADWIGFDIKAPIKIYDRITGKKNSSRQIIQSALELINSGVDYQFRTTFDRKNLCNEDIENIKDEIKFMGGNIDNYVIQTCR